MAAKTDQLNTAVRHQVHLERLSSKIAQDARGVLGKLDSDFMRIALKLDADNLSDLSKKDLKKLIAGIQASQGAVLDAVVTQLAASLKSTASYEAEFEVANLRRFTKAKIAALKAREAYQAALANPLGATGELLEPMLAGWKRKELARAAQTISKGYVNGWTNQQLVTALRGTKKLGYTDGIVAKIGNNAETIVRTSVQHVASTARFQVWENNSDIIEGYELVATLDSDTSPICRTLDGRVFPLGKGPRPPLHYRCRTTTVAKIKEEYSILKGRGVTRSSESGSVSADMTYYDWLKTQDRDVQESVLGKTRAKLFADGGLTAERFGQLNLGRTFEPLTLDQMRKLEPLAFKRAGL